MAEQPIGGMSLIILGLRIGRNECRRKIVQNRFERQKAGFCVVIIYSSSTVLMSRRVRQVALGHK